MSKVLSLLLKRSPVSLAMLCLLTRAQAAVVWNESVNGDLSNIQGSPSSVGLLNGTNSVIGSVSGSTDSQDWLTVTVPAGSRLSSMVLVSYVSGDVQGFTGVRAGSVFVGDPFTASSYLGYAHFGTGAQNGALPATNLVGTDLLPIMGNPSIAFGSAGFTPPLGAGSYAFLIQQLGGPTSYQFNFNVTPIPEPASMVLLALAGGMIVLNRRAVRS